MRWDVISGRVSLPFPIDQRAPRARSSLPRRIGFVVPFIEHDWYRNLINCMLSYAKRLGIEFEAVDAVQLLNEDAVLRQRQIAQVAAAQIGPGEVILIDGSPINTCLAQELAGRSDITVITNALPVFEALRKEPGITLILTGGTFWRPGEILTGPTAAAALRELRADKLFLGITGVTLKFGLSCGNLGEVPVKQAMIRATREVILLADHTRFGQEGVGQIAPITAVHRLITDSALPSSMRLELSKLGVEVIIADTRGVKCMNGTLYRLREFLDPSGKPSLMLDASAGLALGILPGLEDFSGRPQAALGAGGRPGLQPRPDGAPPAGSAR